MRRQQSFRFDAMLRPDYEKAIAELRCSRAYRLGVVLLCRIVVAGLAVWFVVRTVAAGLGTGDFGLRAIGEVGLPVVVLATALAGIASTPLYLVERKCRHKFDIQFLDQTWRKMQFFTLWRDVFTMRLLPARDQHGHRKGP